MLDYVRENFGDAAANQIDNACTKDIGHKDIVLVKLYNQSDSITVYDHEGFDQYGYDKYGFDKTGTHKITGMDFDKHGFDQAGYFILYDIDGDPVRDEESGEYYCDYDESDSHDEISDKCEHCDRKKYLDGYGREYDGQAIFTEDGEYDEYGEYDEGGDCEDCEDCEEFDDSDRPDYEYGFYDLNGFDRDGVHQETLSRYDNEGFDRDGVHRNTGTKYNPAGLNRDGIDIDGYDHQGVNNDEGIPF